MGVLAFMSPLGDLLAGRRRPGQVSGDQGWNNYAGGSNDGKLDACKSAVKTVRRDRWWDKVCDGSLQRVLCMPMRPLHYFNTLVLT